MPKWLGCFVSLPPAPFQPERGADRRSKRNFLVIGYWLLGIENLTGHVNKKPRTRNQKPQNGQMAELSNGYHFQPPGTGEMFIKAGQTFPRPPSCRMNLPRGPLPTGRGS